MFRIRSFVAITALLCLQTVVSRGAQSPSAPPQTGTLHQGIAPAINKIHANEADPDLESPEGTLGKRLFLETRFSEFFATHAKNVNAPLKRGDPMVAIVPSSRGQVPGPYAGQSVNCRSCHFVNELMGTVAGTRAYADYVQRSSVPPRSDGQTRTPRNSRNMVGSMISGPNGLLLHDDGEFSDGVTLVRSTLTGRNFGWLPSEYEHAVKHIARVIREDDGNGALAQLYGGSYAKLLQGTAPDIPPALQITPPYRLDVKSATDEEIVNDVARLITAHLQSLAFLKDVHGEHNGSPYDAFLKVNNLPRMPNYDETDAHYAQRLLKTVEALKYPIYVTKAMGSFQYHNQAFVFGPLEREGMLIFLRQANSTNAGVKPNLAALLMATLPWLGIVLLVQVDGSNGKRFRLFLVTSGMLCSLLVIGGGSSTTATASAAPNPGIPSAKHVGNCSTCHVPPEFTDFSFHNTGATQEEYDAVHGSGQFLKLHVPDLADRQSDRDAYLPATPQHPSGSGEFRSAAIASDSKRTDLGMWNIFANPDYPEPQANLQKVMCGSGNSCDPAATLPRTIAVFKTPMLRDLGQSDPYLHTGRMATLEDVVRFYRHAADLQNSGRLRNGDPAIGGISLDDSDAAALAAFLRSLNEDYD